MGSIVEFNDTLKLIRGDGFPHVIEEGGEYEFLRKGIRIFHPSPVRVFLVEEIDGKWNFVGKVAVTRCSSFFVLDTQLFEKFEITKSVKTRNLGFSKSGVQLNLLIYLQIIFILQCQWTKNLNIECNKTNY